MSNFPQSSIAALAQRALATSCCIRDWLLSPRVQLRVGAHAGAVAGALAADGRPRYVYPEITGYFLHWLAELALADADHDRSAAAGAASAWVARQLAPGSIPKTRSYIDVDTADWRNDALFFFDLAMLLRGVCAVAEVRLIAAPRVTLGLLVEEISRFADSEGSIRAARLLRGDTTLPQRWSTCGGPFEVKAASRVLLAGRLIELPARLEAACERLIDEFTPQTGELAIGMLHPTLYFAEGMLVARPRESDAVATLLRRVLQLQRSDGSLPEAENDSDILRSDIIAQALRVGLLLRARDAAGAPTDDTLAMLAEALLGRVGADGSVCFSADVAAPEANVWCSLFAEQALRWFAWSQAGRALPAAEWLV